jgi:Obg family GTPase CgtA-like protein
MTGEGIDELLARLGLLAKDAEAAEPERQAYVVLRPGRPRFTIMRRDDGTFVVSGQAVERVVHGTDLDDDGDVERLQRALRKMGVFRQLAARGAALGNDVEIAGRVFDYVPDEEGSRG